MVFLDLILLRGLGRTIGAIGSGLRTLVTFEGELSGFFLIIIIVFIFIALVGAVSND